MWHFIKRLIHQAAGVQSCDASLLLFQDQIGYRFSNLDVLVEALTHPSFAGESPQHACSNQRLEFLGDGILGLVVSEHLFQQFPQHDEGSLTRKKSRLVRDTTLAHIARTIDLGSHLRMGVGERKSGGETRDSNLADAFEALIGAIYLDGGLISARRVITKLILQRSDDFTDNDDMQNYKSRLQEYIQERSGAQPTYHVISETGPDHQKTFTVEVRVGYQVLGEGTAPSKKKAEQKAASVGLNYLKQNRIEF